MRLPRAKQKRPNVKGTYYLSYTGEFQHLDMQEHTRHFKLKIELWDIFPSELTTAIIDEYIPPYLISKNIFLEFKCKVYDTRNNTYKVFCYHNGHYAKLVDGYEKEITKEELGYMSQEEIDDFLENMQL